MHWRYEWLFSLDPDVYDVLIEEIAKFIRADSREF
jgi:hypothetical protein